MLTNQFQGGQGIRSGVIKPQQVKIMGKQYLQVLEDLGPVRVYGPRAPVRMLTLAKPGIGHGHDLTDQQITHRLPGDFFLGA